MFTVKWIDCRGLERVLEVRSVETLFVDNPEPLTDKDKQILAVEVWLAEGGRDHITEGRVYVMNDNGKTVANYSLRYPIHAESMK